MARYNPVGNSGCEKPCRNDGGVGNIQKGMLMPETVREREKESERGGARRKWGERTSPEVEVGGGGGGGTNDDDGWSTETRVRLLLRAAIPRRPPCDTGCRIWGVMRDFSKIRVCSKKTKNRLWFGFFVSQSDMEKSHSLSLVLVCHYPDRYPRFTA